MPTPEDPGWSPEERVPVPDAEIDAWAEAREEDAEPGRAAREDRGRP